MSPSTEQCPVDCGDNSCVCAGPRRGGMRTNGGCQCDERQLRRAVLWWRACAGERGLRLVERTQELDKTREAAMAKVAENRALVEATVASGLKIHELEAEIRNLREQEKRLLIKLQTLM